MKSLDAIKYHYGTKNFLQLPLHTRPLESQSNPQQPHDRRCFCGRFSGRFPLGGIEEERRRSHKKIIDDALLGTSVTVVLIGTETANRKYVAYEIEKSLSRGNGVIGVRIHDVKNQDGKTDSIGATPEGLIDAGAKIYTYEYGKLGDWVEAAYKAAKG